MCAREHLNSKRHSRNVKRVSRLRECEMAYLFFKCMLKFVSMGGVVIFSTPMLTSGFTLKLIQCSLSVPVRRERFLVKKKAPRGAIHCL